MGGAGKPQDKGTTTGFASAWRCSMRPSPPPAASDETLARRATAKKRQNTVDVVPIRSGGCDTDRSNLGERQRCVLETLHPRGVHGQCGHRRWPPPLHRRHKVRIHRRHPPQVLVGRRDEHLARLPQLLLRGVVQARQGAEHRRGRWHTPPSLPPPTTLQPPISRQHSGARSTRRSSRQKPSLPPTDAYHQPSPHLRDSNTSTTSPSAGQSNPGRILSPPRAAQLSATHQAGAPAPTTPAALFVQWLHLRSPLAGL